MPHQNQSSEVAAVVQLLANEGFEGMANAMQILLNEAMKLERSEYLNAKPYQRLRIVAAMPTASRIKPSTAAWANSRCMCPKHATVNSIRRLWSVENAVSGLSNWQLPRCMFKAFQPERLLRSPRSSVAPRSPACRSVGPQRCLTKSSKPGERAHCHKSNTSCLTLATKKCALLAA